MIETASGLILRTRPCTETSLVVHWLTAGFGRLATIAKGARRPKSPFRGKLDLFYIADFSFSRSRCSELHTLGEVGLRETHNALRQELVYLQQASYCVELIEQTTETETPLPAIFELMDGLLHHLPAQPPQPQTLFSFELKLLGELGLAPALNKARLNQGTKRLVTAFTESDWPAVQRLRLSEAQKAELDEFLHGFLIYHLGKIPKGRHAALCLLTAPDSRNQGQSVG